jgi:L-2-hydroxyglutarate oxidase LhgO
MDVEVIVIGAGIVGLACARESARQGFSTLLIERHESFGQETSSRNSEVIHSGIYYDPGSWKARLCPAGNRTMYEDCRRLGVWHRRCGKLIVAVTAEEEPEIQKLYDRGVTNGVEDLSLINADQTAQMEPNIRCCSAIYLPSTGIVDSHELMKAYLNEASSLGADVAFGVEFVGVDDKKDGYRLALRERGGGAQKITARFVVNSAGLGAENVARSFGIDVDKAA